MRMMHHEKRTTWHGSVTVFFSLTGVLILCLLLAVVEAVRIQGAKAQTASLEGVANFSVLAEYEKNLLEEFEIFALDGAGGSGSFQIQKSEGRLRYYLKANTDPLSGEGGFGLFDPWRLMLTDCEIQGYALLTDEQGEPFYQQAVAYMKATPQLLADKFPQADTGTIRELKVLGEQYERRQEENDKELDVLEAEKKKQEAEKQQEASEAGEPPVKDHMSAVIPVKNPLIALGRLKRRGTLALVTGDEHVSTTTIPTGAFPSRRHLQNGNLKLEKKNQGMAADALFREYLLMQFPNYCKEAKEELKYQAEYLISGKPSDRKNLKYVVKRLLFLREGLNYQYCLQHQNLNGAAGELALALTGMFGMPALTGAMQHALLLGLAYGESLLDVRILLSGGKIPLLKDVASWKLSFETLGSLGNLLESVDGSETEEGLSYTDYLRILLQMCRRSDLKLRALDLIQYRLQNQEGSECFQAQNAIVAIKTEAKWSCRPVFYSLPQAVFGLGAGGTNIWQSGSIAY